MVRSELRDSWSRCELPTERSLGLICLWRLVPEQQRAHNTPCYKSIIRSIHNSWRSFIFSLWGSVRRLLCQSPQCVTHDAPQLFTISTKIEVWVPRPLFWCALLFSPWMHTRLCTTGTNGDLTPPQSPGSVLSNPYCRVRAGLECHPNYNQLCTIFIITKAEGKPATS